MPVGVERQHEVLGAPLVGRVRGSRRGCGRRATPAARARPWRCTPTPAACCAGRARGASRGCTAGGPRRELAARAPSAPRSPRATRVSSSAVRMMPTRSLHRLLQVLLDRVRVLARPSTSNGASALRGAACTLGVGRPRAGSAQPARRSRAALAGPPAEDQQVRQRVAAEPVGAVHAARAPRRRRTGPGRALCRCRRRPRRRPSRSGRSGRSPSARR